MYQYYIIIIVWHHKYESRFSQQGIFASSKVKNIYAKFFILTSIFRLLLLSVWV